MAQVDLTSQAWRDLVFRPDAAPYGASLMRTSSPRRHNIAVACVALLAAAAFGISTFIKPQAPTQRVVMVEVTTLSELAIPEVKQPEMKRVEPEAPPPPALKSSIKFTDPVIKQDAEVSDADEIKSQAELTESNVAISIADVKGNDEIHGQDIADVQELVVAEAPQEAPPPVLDMAEQMPVFPGGTTALMKHIAAHLRYPTISLENGVEGRVTCQFVVDSDGRVTDIVVLRSLDPYCDKEAIRVIQSLPRWEPGRQNGRSVAVKYTLPIVFRIR